MKRTIALGLLSVSLLATALARAQSAREVTAEELFTAGRALLEEQHFKEACEKFAASAKLDPAVGTLLSLGHCYEAQGLTASAWFSYRSAVAQATQRNDLRRSTAEERAAAIEQRLSTLVIHATDDATQPPMQITVDGEPFASDALGAPIAVDPGPHAVEAGAAGRKSWIARIEVHGPGETVTLAIPALEPVGAPAAPDEAARGRRVRRTLGVVAAGGGVAAMAVGAVLGIEAIEKGRDANRACPGGGACANAGAVQENNTAKSFADASTVTLPVGAALVALGATLFLTAQEPRAPRLDAQASAHGGQLVATWTW